MEGKSEPQREDCSIEAMSRQNRKNDRARGNPARAHLWDVAEKVLPSHRYPGDGLTESTDSDSWPLHPGSQLLLEPVAVPW
jgi:hypothetical protein